MYIGRHWGPTGSPPTHWQYHQVSILQRQQQHQENPPNRWWRWQLDYPSALITTQALLELPGSWVNINLYKKKKCSSWVSSLFTHTSLYLNGIRHLVRHNDVHKEKSCIEKDEYNRGDLRRVYLLGEGRLLFAFFILFSERGSHSVVYPYIHKYITEWTKPLTERMNYLFLA